MHLRVDGYTEHQIEALIRNDKARKADYRKHIDSVSPQSPKAKAWSERWEREFAHRWIQIVPGGGLVPASSVEFKPVRYRVTP